MVVAVFNVHSGALGGGDLLGIEVALVLDALGCGSSLGTLTLPFVPLYFFSVQHFLEQFCVLRAHMEVSCFWVPGFSWRSGLVEGSSSLAFHLLVWAWPLTDSCPFCDCYEVCFGCGKYVSESLGQKICPYPQLVGFVGRRLGHAHVYWVCSEVLHCSHFGRHLPGGSVVGGALPCVPPFSVGAVAERYHRPLVYLPG